MHKKLANAVRALSIDMIENAQSGHPGLPLGMSDFMTVLFKDFLNFMPSDPKWINRDRFILSAGHGSAMIYSILYLLGYEKPSIEDLKNFRKLNSSTPGHPEYKSLDGIETTTGPLGQGLANAVGQAIASKILGARFGKKLISHKIYTLVSDGDLSEGISQESITLAAHLGLNNLIIIFDHNKISIDGPTSLFTSEDQLKRFACAGWNTIDVDGHDEKKIFSSLEKAQNSDKPVFIRAHTKIGFGSPNKSGSEESHGSPLGKQEAYLTKKALEINYGPFAVDRETKATWGKFKNRIQDKYDKYNELLNTEGKELSDFLSKDMSKIGNELLTLKKILNTSKSESTRTSSSKVLSFLKSVSNNFLGGSADLTSSNKTKSLSQKQITKYDFTGNYIHYGIKEHAMAGIVNGIALYGGFTPYAGTFLVFSDYMRPSIRLSAMMNLPVIYIMTHDSIGVGEDGPTHQPIEHLNSLRLIPNLYVFRPCSYIETVECYSTIIKSRYPSVLALTRQDIEIVSTPSSNKNLSENGGYLIYDNNYKTNTKVSIFSSGSEVPIAINTAKLLKKYKIKVRVISVPCMDILLQQTKEYISKLSDGGIRVGLEAGNRGNWDQIIGSDSLFIGIENFGKSGNQKDLFNYFGLTPEKCCQKILRILADDK